MKKLYHNFMVTFWDWYIETNIDLYLCGKIDPHEFSARLKYGRERKHKHQIK